MSVRAVATKVRHQQQVQVASEHPTRRPAVVQQRGAVPNRQVGFAPNEKARGDARHGLAERFRGARRQFLDIKAIAEAGRRAAEGKRGGKPPALPRAVADKTWAKPLARIIAILGKERLTAADKTALRAAIDHIREHTPWMFSTAVADGLRAMGLAKAVLGPTPVGGVQEAGAPPRKAEVLIVGGSIGGYSTALAAIAAGVPPGEIVVTEQRTPSEQTRRQGIGFDAATLNFWKANGVDLSFVASINDYDMVVTHGHAAQTFSRRIGALALPESDATEHHMGLTSIRKAGTGRIFMAEEALRRRLIELGVRLVSDAPCLGLELDGVGGTAQVATRGELRDVSAKYVFLAPGKNNELTQTLGIHREKRVHSSRVNYYATFECDPDANREVHVRVVHDDPNEMPLQISFGSGKYRDVWILNPTFGDISPEELDRRVQRAASELGITANGGPGKLLGRTWRVEVSADMADKIVLSPTVAFLGDSAGSGDFLVGGGANAAVAHAIAAGRLIKGELDAAGYEAYVRDITGQFHRLGKICDTGISVASAGNSLTTSLASIGKKAGRVFFPFLSRATNDAIVDGAWGLVHRGMSAVSGITTPVATRLLSAALQLRG